MPKRERCEYCKRLHQTTIARRRCIARAIREADIKRQQGPERPPKKKPKREAFFVEERISPRCPDPDDCDAKENPSHWVDIQAMPWVVKAVKDAADFMAGFEDDEAQEGINPKIEKIKEALAALKRAQ